MDNLVANPKCKSCKSYWKPCETDILTSGLVAKTCKRCRDYQKELRENRDYSKGKIYVVKSLTSPEIYAGSTIQTLDERWVGHHKDYKRNEVLGLHKDIVKDITEWYIELYELYPCKNKTELTRREGDVIKEIGTLNKNIAGRTVKEWRTDYKEEIKKQRKQYRADHKEEIKQQNKQYNADHKEERKQYDKQYNADHADKIKERKKQYNTDHKEQRKQYNTDHKEERKQYYLKHADKIKEEAKQYRTDHKEELKEQRRQHRLKKKLEKQALLAIVI